MRPTVIRHSIPQLQEEMAGYQASADVRLPTGRPIAITVDGRSFHALTRALGRPFDDGFMACMDAAAIRLTQEAAGARLAFVQSDEVTVILADASGVTEPWFGNRVQKLTSVAASITTSAFLREFWTHFPDRYADLPTFDARCYALPDADAAVRLLIWRQLDALRNSIMMVARAWFTHEQVVGKQIPEILAMLNRVGKPWQALRAYYRIGRAVVRESYAGNAGATRWRWVVNPDTPFIAEHPDWALQHIQPPAP